MVLQVLDEGRYPPADVVVVGGGVSGIAAALAAARTGARTMLIEQSGWLGGIGVNGATGLHTFFNIYGAFAGAPRLRVAAGIAWELVERAAAHGGALGHVPLERGANSISGLTVIDPDVFKLVSAEACQEAGVNLLLQTVMDEVLATAGHVEGLVVWNKAGRSLVRGRQYIDCTGDALLAAGAGAPCVTFPPGQPGSLPAGFTFRLCNVNLAALEADLEGRRMITQLAHAVKPGGGAPDLVRLGIDMRPLHTAGVEHAPNGFLSSSLHPHEITHCNCVNYGPCDSLDPDDLTAASTYLRRRMFEVVEVFRRQFDGCQDAYPAAAAPLIPPRRSRAVHCRYELSEADCRNGRQFDDQIGVFGLIDQPGYWVRDAGVYGIPFRALQPLDLDNVLVAGRLLSPDLIAFSGTRNTVACMIAGQAAGTAAALTVAGLTAVGRAPAEVDVQQLRERLAADGVLLAAQPA